jgi:hypothetical protein
MWQLRELNRKVDLIMGTEGEIMATVDDILNDVAELPTIEDSMEKVFTELAALIEAGKTDPAKLDQAHALVTTYKDKAKASILANTPAAPTP